MNRKSEAHSERMTFNYEAACNMMLRVEIQRKSTSEKYLETTVKMNSWENECLSLRTQNKVMEF